MAIDSALKRKAAAGAGRPWMRGIAPATAGISADERATIGLAYPVATFAPPAAGRVGFPHPRGVKAGMLQTRGGMQ